MEVERHTTIQPAQIPRGAEILFGRPQKRCSALPLCLVRGKGRDQRTPLFPGARGWSLRMSDCTWWRGKWAAAGEAFWPSWPGQRALLWRMSSGWKKTLAILFFHWLNETLCLKGFSEENVERRGVRDSALGFLFFALTLWMASEGLYCKTGEMEGHSAN